VLAGYILPVEKWTAFSGDWDKELRLPPRINYFKMSEAVMAQGEFSTVQSEFRKYKVRKLLNVLKCHGPHGVCSFVRWAQWSEFNRSLRAPHEDPYGLLFFRLIDNVVQYQMNLGLFPEKVQLDFDTQGRSGLRAIEWYGRLIEGVGPFSFSPQHRQILEGTPRMLNDKDYMPLQGADMLAWGVRVHLEQIHDPAWQWVYEELEPTLWGGEGYKKETWDALQRLLF
jgi:hypothetical protein